jgi:hypothetical protein
MRRILCLHIASTASPEVRRGCHFHRAHSAFPGRQLLLRSHPRAQLRRKVAWPHRPGAWTLVLPRVLLAFCILACPVRRGPRLLEAALKPSCFETSLEPSSKESPLSRSSAAHRCAILAWTLARPATTSGMSLFTVGPSQSAPIRIRCNQTSREILPTAPPPNESLLPSLRHKRLAHTAVMRDAG